MTDIEIISLVRALKRRTEEAFNILVNRYKTYVYSVAYKRVGNFSDAEEIAQMVFVEVFEHIRELKEPSKLLSWLYGITDRIALNWLRNCRKRTFSLNEVSSDIPGKDSNAVEMLTLQEESEVKTREAMKIYQSLSLDHQVIVNLKYMEGLSYEDIARRLGVTKDVVRGRLYSAHQSLRRIIK
jgi:RNA polymerase sigma-70 factor (ECF subfamily)